MFVSMAALFAVEGSPSTGTAGAGVTSPCEGRRVALVENLGYRQLTALVAPAGPDRPVCGAVKQVWDVMTRTGFEEEAA